VHVVVGQGPLGLVRRGALAALKAEYEARYKHSGKVRQAHGMPPTVVPFVGLFAPCMLSLPIIGPVVGSSHWRGYPCGEVQGVHVVVGQGPLGSVRRGALAALKAEYEARYKHSGKV
jgi:hypothetical protein